MAFTLRYLAHELPLAEGSFIIGRSDECQLSLDDSLVNRRHASLEVRADRASLTDLGSRNGTFVNGVRIDAQRELQDGDKITIGAQEMQFLKG